MDFPEVRKFLLTTYHDLPNILFMGALILGSIMGYLPLVWVALGMMFNGAVTAGTQLLVKFLFGLGGFLGKYKEYFIVKGADYAKCTVGYQRTVKDTFSSMSNADTEMVAPSYWMSASAFFAAFSIYNSIRVTARDAPKNADARLTATRKAFSISTLITGLLFLGLILARGFTGCESLGGGVLGVLVGAGVAIAYWHILDGCGTGKVPDVLQVVGSIAPEKTVEKQPVMCTAEAA